MQLITHLIHQLIILLPKDLECSARSIYKWFENSQMQENATKSHVLLSRREGRYKS